MSHVRRHRALILAAGVVPLAALGLSACGSSSHAASRTHPATGAASAAPTTTGASTVSAKLSEFKIGLDNATASAGRVTFHVTNTGKVKHQFTIIRTDKPAAKVLDNKNPDDDIPGARGEIASIQPGASKTLVIKNLQAGHYALVCALPGHYQSGMYADFTVR